MSLSELRSEIEKIDAGIVALLNRRTELSIRIGDSKRATNGEFFAPAREEELLATLCEANRQAGGPLPDADLRAIYGEIFSRSRAHQQPLTIGYVGAPAPEAFLAARLRFGSGEVYAAFPDEAALAAALRDGTVHVGIAPAPAASLPGAFRPCGELAIGPNLRYGLFVAERPPSS